MADRPMTFAQGEEIIRLLSAGFDGLDVSVSLTDCDPLYDIRTIAKDIYEHLSEVDTDPPAVTVLGPGQVQCYRDDPRYCAQVRMGEVHKPHQYEYHLPDGSHGAYTCEGLTLSQAGQPWPERPR